MPKEPGSGASLPLVAAAFNSDYSTAIVPESANSSQGGLTGAFYTGNRVIDSDEFYVRAILANGTASW